MNIVMNLSFAETTVVT